MNNNFKECTIDNLEDAINLLDEVLANTKELKDMSNAIYDVNKFTAHLVLEGLYSSKLEDFIEKYMRYYNE